VNAAATAYAATAYATAYAAIATTAYATAYAATAYAAICVNESHHVGDVCLGPGRGAAWIKHRFQPFWAYNFSHQHATDNMQRECCTTASSGQFMVDEELCNIVGTESVRLKKDHWSATQHHN
jgi:hypothetical protein